MRRPIPAGRVCLDHFHALLVLEGTFPGAPGSILHFYAVAYRLAPETPFPGGLEDAYDATTWLASATPELGADSRRLGVAGDWAGANLATGVAMLARAHPSISLAQPAYDIAL